MNRLEGSNRKVLRRNRFRFAGLALVGKDNYFGGLVVSIHACK